MMSPRSSGGFEEARAMAACPKQPVSGTPRAREAWRHEDVAPWLVPLARELGVAIRLRDAAGERVVGEPLPETIWEEQTLWVANRPVGTWSVPAGTPAPIREVLQPLFAAFGESRYAIQDLAESLAHAWKESNFLDELTHLLQDVFAVAEAAQVIVRQLARVQRAESVVLYLKQGEDLEVAAAFPAHAAIQAHPELPMEADAPAWVLPGPAGSVCVPLRDGAHTVGALCLGGGERLGHAANLRFLANVGAQIALAVRHRFLIQQEMEALAFRRELLLAAEIQRGLLPQACPRLPGLVIAATCRPAQEVGGDGYDFSHHALGLDVVVADVSGHGVAAGLLMSSFLSMFRVQEHVVLSPSEIATRANRHVVREVGDSGHFVTALVARLTVHPPHLTYATMGHPAPLLCRHGEALSLPQADGLPAGIWEEGAYAEREVRLQPGDVLLLYTDGLIEARSPEGAFWGLAGLRGVLEAHAEEPLEQLLEAIFTACHAFAGRRVEDDQTLIAIALRSEEETCARS